MILLLTYCLRRSHRSSTAASSPNIQHIQGSVPTTTEKGGSKEVESIGRRNSDGLLHVPFRDRPVISPGLGSELGIFKDGGIFKNGGNSKTGQILKSSLYLM